jgi:hypothetical protein
VNFTTGEGRGTAGFLDDSSARGGLRFEDAACVRSAYGHHVVGASPPEHPSSDVTGVSGERVTDNTFGVFNPDGTP